MSDPQRTLPQDDFIRHKLFSGDRSSLERYAGLVIGGLSYPRLIAYELITTLFGYLPGALGLALRKVFYPLLFKRSGKGVVFGRSLTIRNAQNIVLGDRVVIDDFCLLDARGGGAEGIVIGDEAVIHRGASLQARAGSIRVGANSDVGAASSILTQGEGIYIGDMVSLGGGCKVGGGTLRLGASGAALPSDGGSRNDFSLRGQERVTRGPIRIEDKVVLAMSVTVLDGVTVGAGSVVGAGAVLRQSVPSDSVVMPHERMVIVSRGEFVGTEATTEPAPADTRVQPTPEPSAARVGVSEPADRVDAVRQAVLRAVSEINQQLPYDSRIDSDLSAPLVEPAGPLDSLGLINLVVALEDRVMEEFGVKVTLVDSLAGPDPNRPFATVGSLVSHVTSMVDRQP